MNRILCLLAVMSITWCVSAQKSDLDVIIDQGVALYDHGLYEDALKKYSQALTLDKKSLRAKYEMASAYMAMGKFRETLYYSYEVLDKESDYYMDACLLYGSALDKSGRKKQAVRFYNKTIKTHPKESLLYYNLSLCHYSQAEWDKAQGAVEAAIRLNKTHLDSHLLLSSVMYKKGKRLKSMLPLYYYLLYDQDSKESVEAHQRLIGLWSLSSLDRHNHKKMPISSQSNKGMLSLEIGLKELANDFVVNDDKRQMEQPGKLAEQTKGLLNLMEDVDMESLDFFDLNYIDFFKRLTKSGYADVYAHYISTCVYKEKIMAWITENNKSFLSFMDWMELQQ